MQIHIKKAMYTNVIVKQNNNNVKPTLHSCESAPWGRPSMDGMKSWAQLWLQVAKLDFARNCFKISDHDHWLSCWASQIYKPNAQKTNWQHQQLSMYYYKGQNEPYVKTYQQY